MLAMRILRRLKYAPWWVRYLVLFVVVLIGRASDVEFPDAGWFVGLGVGLLVFAWAIQAGGMRWRDSISCTKCGHAKRDHQGPCQECLRDVQRGDPRARTVPCGRYSREAQVGRTGSRPAA